MLDKFSDVIDILVTAVPSFLSAEPIIYFVGIFVALFVVKVFINLINIRR